MARLVLVFLVLLLTLPAVAVAQVVTISVPAQRYKAQEKIPASVENNGNGAVTFCVEVGQTSSKEGGIESTPSPFWVQRNSNGKWGTLMIGPDVGSLKAATVLAARESKEFPFRLNGSGRMRLRLNYWRGSTPNLDCNAPPKGSKLVTSAVFTID